MHNQHAKQATAGRVLARWLAQGLAVALAFVMGAVVMHVGMHGGDAERMHALQEQVQSKQLELVQAVADQAALRSDLEVQDGTVRALQNKILDLQHDLGNTRDQLAFYEQLIPPGPAGGVAIRAFEIRPEGEFLHYRVLLTRNAPAQSEPFKGRMRFVAQGSLDGEAVKIDLNPPVAPVPGDAETETNSAGVDPLALTFEQFQRSTGVLQQESGLKIQSVRLEILEDDIVRATQDVVLNRTDQTGAGASS